MPEKRLYKVGLYGTAEMIVTVEAASKAEARKLAFEGEGEASDIGWAGSGPTGSKVWEAEQNTGTERDS